MRRGGEGAHLAPALSQTAPPTRHRLSVHPPRARSQVRANFRRADRTGGRAPWIGASFRPSYFYGDVGIALRRVAAAGIANGEGEQLAPFAQGVTDMWNKTLAAVLTVGLIGTTSSLVLCANELPKYMPTAKVSLQEALRAAEDQGQPISGKYEVDEGHLQLSVYTAKDGKFSEVLVDQNTGKVSKSQEISGTELADAQKQMEAYSKSKISLRAAVSQAELAYPGYHAVSVTPTLSKGRPVAIVSLLQGTQTRSIAEPLG